MLLSIEHITHYRYRQKVQFGTHRLLIRPLEGHDVQIRSSHLTIEPVPRIRWIHDSFDNSIALAEFPGLADELRIASLVTVEQFNTNPFDFVLSPEVLEVPFQYQPEDSVDVQAYLRRQFPEDEDALRKWTTPFLNASGKARTLDFLTALNRSVPLYFTYLRREETGVQSPARTLQLRSGSCRDFALLLMETARTFGLAARFVSGYLCRTAETTDAVACDATHAWAEIYLPGAGWKGFDPTSGILAADAHVRVAVTRTPLQAAPISGGYVGPASALADMQVTVDAHAIPQP